MDPINGGQSSADRQRQTAAEIARKKVLESYRSQPESYAAPQQQPGVNEEEWRKYHSAWQEYYQRYYGDYYGQAARDYVEQAKLKFAREQSDRATRLDQNLDGMLDSRDATPDTTHRGLAIQNNIRAKIRQRASDRTARIRRSRHFIPIIIGLSIIVLGALFQYNQVIIANAVAFVAPSGGSVNEITAIDPTINTEVGPEPLLIIPKLNVEVPITFNAGSDQKSMDIAMGNGVAHFSFAGVSALPGEIGNFAISGHSAGNIYQNSNYKFIFSGLSRLNKGDLIYVNYKSTRYTYSIVGDQTVEPTNVQSLVDIAKNNPDKPMITLITCTPLGTSRYRLLVYAEQISPDSSDSATPEPTPTEEEPADIQMPANQPSPLEQFWLWITGQA